MMLGAEIRVMLEVMIVLRGDGLGDVQRRLVNSASDRCLPGVIGLKGPVAVLGINAVARMVRARRVVVVITRPVILFCRMNLKSSRSLTLLARRGGPPSLLRRRRLALDLAVIGMPPLGTRLAAVMNRADTHGFSAIACPRRLQMIGDAPMAPVLLETDLFGHMMMNLTVTLMWSCRWPSGTSRRRGCISHPWG